MTYRLALLICAAISWGAGPVRAQAPDTCNRAAMEAVIGQTSFFATQVIYDIAAVAPERIVRFLRPGDAPGPENTRRLSVVFDGDGRVTRVFCG